MGSAQSNRFIPDVVTNVPGEFLSSLGEKEGVTIVQKRQPVFKGYIEACSSFSGVVHEFNGPTQRTPEKFKADVMGAVPTLHRLFVRRGQRSFIHDGVFFFVLVGAQAKQFQAHMKALEAIAFLAIPGVVTPQTAMVHHLGVSVACMELRHLLASQLKQTTKTFGEVTGKPSRHVQLVRSLIGSSLRLGDDPAVVLYTGGDGTLVVVDASHLLPPLTTPGASGKYWHCARPELLLCIDCPFSAPVCGKLHPPRESGTESETKKSALSLCIDAASTKKRHHGVPTLNACNAMQSPSSSFMSEKLQTVGAPSPSAENIEYEFRFAHGFKTNEAMTNFIIKDVVANAATVLESLPEQATCADLARVLRSVGVGINALGHLWHSVDLTSHARTLIGVEMVSRGVKRWLERQLLSDSSQTEAFVMHVFRGIGDEQFINDDIMPFCTAMFGQLVPLPTSINLPFKLLFERVQQQTGAHIVSGKLTAMVPRCHVARQTFRLTSAEENAVCSVCATRQDGLAATLVVNSVAKWTDNGARQSRLVEQFAARARQKRGSPLMAMMECLLKIDLFKAMQKRKLATEGGEMMAEVFADGGIYNICHENSHDRLFATRHALEYVDALQKAGKTNLAIAHVRLLLAMGPLNDTTGVHPVASRTLMEEVHRVGIETCFTTRQFDEALAVCQRWQRSCSLLFGPVTKAQCRAAKIVLVALTKARRRTDAVRAAQEYVALTAAVFGKESLASAHAVGDHAALVWKRNPALGLQLYQQSMDLYVRCAGPTSRGVCTSLYNIGLASARMNRLHGALHCFTKARLMAAQLNEVTTGAMCQRSENTVLNVAATKIQRWYREFKYGQAKSQTTRTDVSNTLCSALSWSTEEDEISSAGGID